VRLLSPPTAKPPKGRLVEESARENLSAAASEGVLAELRSKVSASPHRRLSLRWRITEEEPGS
jgi:hypothetical protein